MAEVRVRFAPSPTGSLHIGGARTALFNWLYARHHGGKFILRIEDTDTLRSTEDSTRGIIEGLEWIGIDWDEGPYQQSERLPIYKKYLQELLDTGKAYYCFCTPDELRAEREKAAQEKKDYRYSEKCRNLTPDQIQERLQQGLKPVIRIKVPTSGHTVVSDLIRGNVKFENSLVDDFIIAKSDGWPTYNFAVVVDDFTMKISHVIRAEEHLSNTPKQLLIYDALGFTPPHFAHVSMILAPDRSKLSKRHGATSVQEFRDQGYLPESLVNYLALLGWSPGEDKDILSISEMIEKFDLDHISKSAAIYDIKKLTWMNGHYLAQADINVVLALINDDARARGWLTDNNKDHFVKVIDLVRTRVKTVTEILDDAKYFFTSIDTYDEKGLKKYFMKSGAREKLGVVLDIIDKVTQFNSLELEDALREQAEIMGIKASELIHPTRLAISGRRSTPGLFEVMELLGKNTCNERIKVAINYIDKL